MDSKLKVELFRGGIEESVVTILEDQKVSLFFFSSLSRLVS